MLLACLIYHLYDKAGSELALPVGTLIKTAALCTNSAAENVDSLG